MYIKYFCKVSFQNVVGRKSDLIANRTWDGSTILQSLNSKCTRPQHKICFACNVSNTKPLTHAGFLHCKRKVPHTVTYDACQLYHQTSLYYGQVYCAYLLLHSRFPCCVLLVLSWNTNENPSTDKLSRAINQLVHRHPAVGTSSSNEGLSVKKGPATNNWTQTRACVSDRIRSNLFIYLVKHLVRINSPFQEILVSIAGGYKLFILRVRLYKVKYKEKYLVLLVLGHD